MSYNHATMPISLTSYKKLNPDREFIVINLYPVSKEINSINNSAQRLANNIKFNNGGLGCEKNIISMLPNFSVFLDTHLHNAFITAKNAENGLQQGELPSANLYSVPFDGIREKEPIYHIPNDDIAKQKFINNQAPYSVIGDALNNGEVYYDAQRYATVGEQAHIYDEIDNAAGEEAHIYEAVDDSAVGEETHIYETVDDGVVADEAHIYEAVDGSIVGDEPIYEEIDNYTREAETEHLNSKKEINLSKPNNLSPIEKKVFTEVELNNERKKITRLAEQTFAPPRSFITRLTSSIWNALFGAKNESVVISKDKLVTDAMRVNIEGICNALNKQINNGEVDGLFRKEPAKATYDKNSPKQLVEVFNSDKCYSDPIGLAWMIKHYIAESLPKITIKEFNDSNNQAEFKDILDNKINQIECNITRENIKNCFVAIKETLNAAEKLETAKKLLEKNLISAKEFNLSKEFDLAKVSLTKKLNVDKKLLDNGLEVHEHKDDKKIIINSTLTKDSIIGSMLTAFIAKSADPIAELNFMRDKQSEFSNLMAKYVANNY
ncbi:hypothetical protein QE197_08940 [Arsenophonus nasoniae]|uniref:Uncharacterized protein n=2 Tax=Arsenophonus nasoniae TaxID=638 RepID=D2TZ77_9GAMM|nr:hypothetical protein [Arsenophonus nasoniae]QBY43557.1 hypothetical protein ArsFIN_21250 [Arsenophonus nasoniae]WGM07520.1 hypothetical protein QE258_09925 [Arsenophonus nasoniae]WGM12377.1 hypothetical protein QE197_08940 [Arsenophonus nasoniae]WGM17056.1 hypothetical protein QE193_08825 [Arsenophonus nasoniae]CBA72876.1 hypothetical protein ARN_14830 [Arsenophonus nasoniae]